MNKNFVYYFTIVMTCIVLFTTTPNFSQHRTAINDKFKSQNTFLGLFNVGKYAADLTTFQTFLFFSVSYYQFDKNEKPEFMSFGIMNQVYVRDLNIE